MASAPMDAPISVSIKPGARQFTRIAGPKASAQLLANAMTPAFDVL